MLLLFGPLDISYCLFFYIISIVNLFICFCLFLLLILNLKIVKNKNATEICFSLILFFMIFFQNRLLYSMCKKDVKMEIIEPSESIDKLQLVLDKISAEQTSNANQLTEVNQKLGGVSQNISATLTKNTEIFNKVKEHSEKWNSIYPTIQSSMNGLDHELKVIRKNTTPLQYSYITNVVNK